MRPVLLSRFALFTLAVGIAATAQNTNAPQPIPPGEASVRLVKGLDPVFPPLAQIARICGVVNLSITISPTGDVSDDKLIRGHPMLAPAAITAVKGWKYKPFEADGSAIPVTTQANVVFPCGEIEIAEQGKFYPQARKCRDLIESFNYADAERECQKAVKISDGLSKALIGERSSARTLLAIAILSQRRPAEAIPLMQAALDLDKGHLDPDDAGLASDYWRLGDMHSAAGDLAKADELYATAISALEAAIQKWPAMKGDYTRRLKIYLGQYATVKQAQGQSDAAQQLRKKAAELQH